MAARGNTPSTPKIATAASGTTSRTAQWILGADTPSTSNSGAYSTPTAVDQLSDFAATGRGIIVPPLDSRMAMQFYGKAANGYFGVRIFTVRKVMVGGVVKYQPTLVASMVDAQVAASGTVHTDLTGDESSHIWADSPGTLTTYSNSPVSPVTPEPDATVTGQPFTFDFDFAGAVAVLVDMTTNGASATAATNMGGIWWTY